MSSEDGLPGSESQQIHERGSLVRTSNRAIVEWYLMIRDELVGSCAVDRLLHNAYVVVMGAGHFRNPPEARRAP